MLRACQHSNPFEQEPWVCHYFRVERREAVWPRIHDALRPKAAIRDSRSVQTTDKEGPEATTRARR